MKATVKLVSISEVKTEKDRTDSKPSRKYYTAYFADTMNPFAKQIQRNFFQDHTGEVGKEIAVWKSGDPAIVKTFIGKEIPGEFLNVTVTPYTINDRLVTSFSTVVLANEKLATVLKQANHTLPAEIPLPISQISSKEPISSSTALNN